MPRPAAADGLDKFRRFRARQERRGMKLLRIWVTDPNAPGFAAELRRQGALLRGAPEEIEMLDFIAAIADLGADLADDAPVGT